MVRVTVEDAKRLIREASPLEVFVNVYVSPDGGIEARREECRAPYLEADFPGLLQSLGIVPRHKWRPHITQYAGGNDYGDLQYTVTRDEAQRVAEAFGVSLDAAPAPSASAPAVAAPEPVAAINSLPKAQWKVPRSNRWTKAAKDQMHAMRATCSDAQIAEAFGLRHARQVGNLIGSRLANRFR